MNIRQRRRSLTFLAALLIVLSAAVAYWTWLERESQKAELIDLQSQATAFEKRMQTREQVLAEIRLLEARNPSGNLLLQGATAAIAAAELQGLANNIIEAANGRVQSSELMRPEDISPFLEVGVVIQFVATIEALRDVLYDLEVSVPAIIVVSIDATQDDEFTRELRVTLQIKGFANAAGS